MDRYTPMSEVPSTPASDCYYLTVDPADTDLRQTSVSFADDLQDTKPSTSGGKEKKPAKKRKSWGQELPTPKTNLPPRKRAKTEDEKEQRRIERVLRNRAAAQSSRERRRVEVEQLEDAQQHTRQENAWLVEQLREERAKNERLSQELAKLSFELSNSRQGSPRAFQATSPTLAPTLFKNEAQDTSSLEHIPHEAPSLEHSSSLDPSTFLTPSTLNESISTPPDLTQHPAAMLWTDLQCQSGISSWTITPSISTATRTFIQSLLLIQLNILSLMMSFNASSPVMTSLLKMFTSLKSGLPMTISDPAEMSTLLILTHWLISKPDSSQTSTPRSAFRSQLLRRLLACTPALARPLKDATSAALLLASENGQTTEASIESQGMDRQQWETLTRMKWVIEQMEASDSDESGNEDPVDNIRKLRQLFDGNHRVKSDATVREKDNVGSMLNWRSGNIINGLHKG